jgi:hypothetical protein
MSERGRAMRLRAVVRMPGAARKDPAGAPV